MVSLIAAICNFRIRKIGKKATGWITDKILLPEGISCTDRNCNTKLSFQVTCMPNPIRAGGKFFATDNVCTTSGFLPARLLVTFVSADAYKGAYNKVDFWYINARARI